MFLEISQNSQGIICATGVSLWILWNFQGHLFYRTPPDDCFCELKLFSSEHILFSQSVLLNMIDLNLCDQHSTNYNEDTGDHP